MSKMKKFLALGLSQVMVASVLAGGLVTSEVQAASVKSYKGHYYMFVNKVVDAGTAEYMCDAKGAHLVTLTSAAEEKFVKENLSGDTDIWLGAKKVNGKWKWVTGEKFSYTNWHEDEPSNDSEEIYLSTWEGTWDDCTVTKNLFSDGNAYVMEWDSKSAYDAYVSGNTKKMAKNITGRKAYNGHVYKYYDMKTTWKKASSSCKKMGGYLVTLTSTKENNFAYNLCGKSNVWIGLNDAKKEGKFVWVTGERTDYLNFGNNLNNDFDGKEDYIGFYGEKKWNDY
ncbi:MAG: lectin-like protein, partial [Lachnospiraceae bacterium]